MAISFRSTLLLVAATLAFLLSASLSHAGSTLTSGKSLRNGQSIAHNGYLFIMQSNCDLVLYDTGKVIWSTHTAGRGRNCLVRMQKDGNLVIYNNGDQVIWASGSNGAEGSYVLVMQADRNVVIYEKPGNRFIWATFTHVSGTSGAAVAPQNSTNAK